MPIPLITRWTQTAVRAAETALGLIYPPVCQLCGQERATATDGYVGPACRRQLRYLVPPFCHRCGLPYEGAITQAFECANCREVDLAFESVRSAVLAEGVALEVIHRFKYQRARWFEPFLGELLVQAAKPILSTGGWDCIVPVPLHPVKQREREFNQAEILARALSHVLHLPVRTDLVRRVEPTRTQTRLSRAERAANVRRAFRSRPGHELNGAAVVLVDDVLTTGATTDAVARQLRRIGASRICVWAVARAVLTGSD